jgi:imidazolonepropionase-like amidohydrolase
MSATRFALAPSRSTACRPAARSYRRRMAAVYGDMCPQADGPDDMRRAVREQIRAEADFIKVMATGARSSELEDPDPLLLTEAEPSRHGRGRSPPALKGAA